MVSLRLSGSQKMARSGQCATSPASFGTWKLPRTPIKNTFRYKQCSPRLHALGPEGGSDSGSDSSGPQDPLSSFPSFSSSPKSGTTEDAFEVGTRCMNLFISGDTASIISYLPDAVIDNALERKRSKLTDLITGRASTVSTEHAIEEAAADLTLTELIELAPPGGFSVDSFAMRGLVMAPPLFAVPLSTLRMNAQRCRCRYLLSTRSGEEINITLDLQLEETVEPRYRGFSMVEKWFIRGLSGEPAAAELPTGPAPCHGPETIVAAQLAALKARDAKAVFSFASPRNKEAFDGSIERFSEMLHSEGYTPLLGHTHAEVLRSTQMNPTRNFAVVGVTCGGSDGTVPQRHLYGWSLALQQGEDGGGQWTTEAVYPLGYGFHAGFYAL